MNAPLPSQTSHRPRLQWVRRAIVVADVVESVRLMQSHGAEVIERWRRFVAQTRDEVLPLYGGRLVKHLGDGMLLEFQEAAAALDVALDLHHRLHATAAGRPDDTVMRLRVGVHVADVVIDELDVFGPGVNLAARLASIAHPGGVVLSGATHRQMTLPPDLEVDDLGDRWLKHITVPVRAVQLWRRGVERPLPTAASPSVDLTIGTLNVDAADARLATVLCDAMLAELSRGGGLTVARQRGPVGRGHVLGGRCVQVGQRVAATFELSDARTGRLVAVERVACDMSSLLHEPCDRIRLAALRIRRLLRPTLPASPDHQRSGSTATTWSSPRAVRQT